MVFCLILFWISHSVTLILEFHSHSHILHAWNASQWEIVTCFFFFFRLLSSGGRYCAFEIINLLSTYFIFFTLDTLNSGFLDDHHCYYGWSTWSTFPPSTTTTKIPFLALFNCLNDSIIAKDYANVVVFSFIACSYDLLQSSDVIALCQPNESNYRKR